MVEKAKLGAGAKPKLGKETDPRRSSIRPETDNPVARPSRHIPSGVKRAVSKRDGNRCAFVSPEGRRCTQRAFLEFHHVQPFALQGPATVENVVLQCRGHNVYESERIFGRYEPAVAREAPAIYACSWQIAPDLAPAAKRLDPTVGAAGLGATTLAGPWAKAEQSAENAFLEVS